MLSEARQASHVTRTALLLKEQRSKNGANVVMIVYVCVCLSLCVSGCVNKAISLSIYQYCTIGVNVQKDNGNQALHFMSLPQLQQMNRLTNKCKVKFYFVTQKDKSKTIIEKGIGLTLCHMVLLKRVWCSFIHMRLCCRLIFTMLRTRTAIAIPVITCFFLGVT